MKPTLCITALTFGLAGAAAGPFENLGFDDGNLRKATNYGTLKFGATADLLPGWQVFSGPWPVERIGLDTPLAGLGFATLVSDVTDVWAAYRFPPPEGGFSLFLVGDQLILPGEPPPYDTIPYHVVQRAEIPSDALSLRFFSYDDPWQVSLNGAPLPVVYGDTNRIHLILGAHGAVDVSAFAGQEVELRFTTGAFSGLDSIYFSPEPVPEPGALWLLGLGGLALWLGRRKR